MVTITSYPFENLDTTESQFSRLFVELQDTGVCDTPDSTALKVSANGNDLTLTIEAGFAIVRGHAMDSSAQEFRTLEAAEANPRIDRVVLRLDPIANQISIEVLKGTASASPTAPALTQTVTGIYETPLAQILVPAAALAIAPANVTDERRWSGNRIGAWSTATRPTQPRKSQFGFNITIGDFEYYDGTTWKLVVDPTRFLAASGKAVDSDKLDGLDSTAFLLATGKAVDSDKLDGIDSLTFARRDQANNFAGTVNVTSGQLQEGGQRVYSPNNPPPINAMSVLGGASGAHAPTSNYAEYAGAFTFVAPSNGRVAIGLSCDAGSYMQCPSSCFTYGSESHLSFTIDGVVSAADSRSVKALSTYSANSATLSGGETAYTEIAVTGLSPGATYTIRPMLKNSSGGAVTVNWALTLEG